MTIRPTHEPPENVKTLPNAGANVAADTTRKHSVRHGRYLRGGCVCVFVCVSQSQSARKTKGEETRGRSVVWVS